MTIEELAGRVRATEEVMALILSDAICASPDPGAAAKRIQDTLVAHSQAVALDVKSGAAEAEALDALMAASAILDIATKTIKLAAASQAHAGTAN